MLITRIYLKGFKNFKEAISFKFDRLNLISGLNGKGKSSLAVDSILFAIYGYSSQTLEKLVTRSLKKKECLVKIELENNNKKLIIERAYPTSLTIFEDGIRLQFPNTKETQDYLNSLFANVDRFKKFRMIDSKEGINILEEGKTSLKKTLLSLQEDWFNNIRQKLLDKKRIREEFNISKRLYKFYLSENRLKTLEEGYNRLSEEYQIYKDIVTKNKNIINDFKVDIANIVNLKLTNLNIKNSNNAKIIKNNILITDYKFKINKLNEQPLKETIYSIDYGTIINENENINTKNIAELQKVIDTKDIKNKQILALNNAVNRLENEIKIIETNIHKFEEEILGLEGITINTKCDLCGSLVTEKHRKSYKGEKETIIISLTEELKGLNNKQYLKEEELNAEICNLMTIENEIKDRNKGIENIRDKVKTLNVNKFIQIKEIEDIKAERTLKQSNIIKYTELIEVYDNENINLKIENENIFLKDKQLDEKFIILNNKLEENISILDKDLNVYEKLEIKKQLTFKRRDQLKEAFKFAEYKYTQRDLLIINKCIKELDNFYNYFITEWIKTLEPIINTVLDKIGFKISFKDDFDIVLYKDNDEYSYKDLSTGQKLILSLAVKLAILLERGEKGIVICDEGFANLDEINLKYVLQLCKDFPFQLISVIHRFSIEDDSINHIEL